MDFDKVSKHIVSWLHDYCKNAQSKGFVVGISGGIDSALTSTLCAQTGLPTLVLSMPIKQHPSELSRAHEHMAWLKQNFPHVESQELDLTETFIQFTNAFPKQTSRPPSNDGQYPFKN